MFVVEGAGHASTCGGRVDMAAAIRNKFPDIAKQNNGRTEMKSSAASTNDEWFGMEPRYDEIDGIAPKLGLSPLKYWSKEYYKPWNTKKKSQQQ